MKPKVCVLRTAGTNCDKETAFAFSVAGADAQLVHVNNLACGKASLFDYHILALPGGFSYGDDIASGKIFANELRHKLSAELKDFIRCGKLIIGICNGFQILVKSGFLPGNDSLSQEASLIINDSGKFEDRWVYLREQRTEDREQRVGDRGRRTEGRGQSKCVWTKGVPDVIYLPVAHGEGKFVVKDKKVLSRINKGGQVVFRYCDSRGNPCGYPDDPNGSLEHIAGICDATGRVFGLMPHPERHIHPSQHPRFSGDKSGDGLKIFTNGVEYIKKHF
jgi:phosphoribosylformylglycinamidine synthase